MSKKHKAPLLEEGGIAPAFELKSLTNSKVSLESLIEKKPVVVVFYKVSCPVCQMTVPFLERMSRSRTHQFVGISQDHAGATEGFNSKFGIRFQTLLDSESSGYPASNAFGISYVPTAFLIEPSGKISWTMEGFSKAQMKDLGDRAGVQPFSPGEYVPEWKSG